MVLSVTETADFLKGVGEPTRLRVLGLLRHGELCVCDIMTVLELPQSTASRHLAYLRNAGWLESRRKKKWMYYRLRTTPQTEKIMAEVLHHISRLTEIEKDYRAMAHHLAEKNNNTCK